MFENIKNREEKEKIAQKLAEKVENGQLIGFGSGSTSYLTVLKISEKIKEKNINIIAVPTSYEIKLLCNNLQIPTIDFAKEPLDWCFDGADEVSKENWLIKGRGGAMFKEKINIANSKKTYILIDKTKRVEKLGQKYMVPIECSPNAIYYVIKELENNENTQKISLRMAGESKDGPIITENGNFILDVKFKEIDKNLEKILKSITGVIETGLFIDYPLEILE